MLTLVSYNISKKKDTNNLIKKLYHFGFHKIQESLFASNLNSNKRMELLNDLEIFLSSDRDSIIVFPICGNCKDSISIFSGAEIILPSDKKFEFV